jgi:D-alanyl-D-alanine carboxypeptidase
LQAVVAAGAPGAFARIEDARSGDPRSVGVGTGDLSTRRAIDPGGAFRVGSVTKNFTAVLVLQLVADRQVDLDGRAEQYLPRGVLSADSLITVRQLLSHTSGLYDYTDDLLTGDSVTAFRRVRYRTYRPADLVALAAKHGSQFKPGSQYQYSNTNFVVLGMLLEHVTGLPYATVLDRRILTPLGLTHTRFVVPKTNIDEPHATGYLTADQRSQPLTDATDQTASWIWSAGAIISSAADLNRYLRALATGELLPPELLTAMETTRALDSTGTSRYGLGLRSYRLSCGVTVIGHDGILQGYQTYAYTTSDGSRQVTVSANASNNSAVFAAERRALDPAFCGTPAPAAGQRAANASSVRAAGEEAAG